MLHTIPAEKHGALGEPMAKAVQTCVHCGFCLAACPTYQELGQEMDSPRGRIVLMKEVLEGTLREFGVDAQHFVADAVLRQAEGLHLELHGADLAFDLRDVVLHSLQDFVDEISTDFSHCKVLRLHARIKY